MTSIADTTDTSQQEQRAAALKDLHRVIDDGGRFVVDRHHAIMMMAMRYGAARASLQAAVTGNHIAWELAERARHRRFAALQRLVYGGAR